MSAKQFLDLTGLGVLAEYIPQEIGDLEDIVITNISNGQILKWNATNSRFENADESGGDPVFIGTKAEWNALTAQEKAVYDGCQVLFTDDYDVQVKIDDTTPASNKVYSSQKTQNELDEKLSYADNGILGAKNLLPNNATTQTVNGVTFTVNADGSITANGTATADVFEYIKDNNDYSDVILSGCPSGGALDKFCLQYSNFVDQSFNDYGSGVAIPSTKNTGTWSVCIYVKNGTTISNIVFKPMIRLATDTDDTYVPYAMTNRQLTQAMPVWTSGVTALQGATSCAITNDAISSTSILEPYADNGTGDALAMPSISVSSHTATLTFDALEHDTTFYLKVTNL